MTGAVPAAKTAERRRRGSLGVRLLNAPYIVWSVLFIVIPLLMVVYYAFSETVNYYDVSFSAGGQSYSCEIPNVMDNGTPVSLFDAKEQAASRFGYTVAEVDFDRAILKNRTTGFTLSNFREVFRADSLTAIRLSFLYSIAATLISLIISYPFAYFLSRTKVKTQRIQMLLIMLPMWMNMLVRTYSWQQILENNGIINKFLSLLGVGPVTMLGTSGAVILGMVYNYLPYMILPIYTIMAKIDPSLLEAADDLGCNGWNRFVKLILPLSVPGVVSGLIMVFVPSISTFYISQQMSNGMIKLVGDLIESKIKEQWSSGGLNIGSAMSFVLMIVILLCTFIMNRFADKDGGDIVV